LEYLFDILEIKIDGILTPIPQPIVTDLAILILHSHCATMALPSSYDTSLKKKTICFWHPRYNIS
jgi:hypothetical protein